MTNGEAIDILKEIPAHIGGDCDGYELRALEIALEKQIPKGWMYIALDDYKKYKVVCPVCHEQYIGNYDSYDEPYDFNYCPNCGQRLVEGETE